MDNYFSLISEIDRDLKTDESFDIIKRELIIAERQAVLYFCRWQVIGFILFIPLGTFCFPDAVCQISWQRIRCW